MRTSGFDCPRSEAPGILGACTRRRSQGGKGGWLRVFGHLEDSEPAPVPSVKPSSYTPSVQHQWAEHLGVFRDVLPDARRRPADDRLEIVGQPVIPVVGMELG